MSALTIVHISKPLTMHGEGMKPQGSPILLWKLKTMQLYQNRVNFFHVTLAYLCNQEIYIFPRGKNHFHPAPPPAAALQSTRLSMLSSLAEKVKVCMTSDPALKNSMWELANCQGVVFYFPSKFLKSKKSQKLSFLAAAHPLTSPSIIHTSKPSTYTEIADSGQ